MGAGAMPTWGGAQQSQDDTPAIQRRRPQPQPSAPPPSHTGDFRIGATGATSPFDPRYRGSPDEQAQARGGPQIGSNAPGMVVGAPGGGFNPSAMFNSWFGGGGGGATGGTGIPAMPALPKGGYGAPGGYTSSSYPGASAPPSGGNVATATPDPHLTQLWQQYQDRLSSDPTQRAIDRAQQSIKAQGQAQQNMADVAGAAAGRGPGYRGADISDAALRAGAGAAADISLGREQQLNQMVLGGLPLATAQPQLALQQQQLGLGQQRLGLEEWMAPQQLGLDYMRTQAAMLSPMLGFMSSMYGGGGGGAGYGSYGY
jgi:hypothetical protein